MTIRRLSPAIAIAVLVSATSGAQEQGKALDEAGIARLAAETNGTAQVSMNAATGAARFVRLAKGQAGAVASQRALGMSHAAPSDRSRQFLTAYGSIFGVRDQSTELAQARVTTDRAVGGTHIVYRQLYRGVPVFGGELRSHLDGDGDLVAINGTFVPEIGLDPKPKHSSDDAARTAVAKVAADLGESGLTARSSRLLVFREGLAQGVPGPNHLAWEVEVGDGANVREFVFVDAHSGKFIDQITGVYDAMFRRAYDGLNLNGVPPSYPGTPFWVEGDAFPTLNIEADNMILSSKETYDFHFNAFGRDSFDNGGAIMDAIFNRGYSCPNASWNGTFISFCPGLTTDDVTGHEWSHAYTQYTDNLIYQWQPGALNEASSDIFGETIDRINGRDGVTPDSPRAADSCSLFTPLPPTVTVNPPAPNAGVKTAGTAAFGPQAFGLTNDVVLANDGAGVTNDGCCATADFFCPAGYNWTNKADIAGKIVFVDRGTCGFAIKAKNAQVQGAIGVIVGNNQGGTAIINMAGVDATITIPSLSVTQNDGTAFKAALGVGAVVNAALSRGQTGTDNSVRWLLGEDDTGALPGALRDMWNPNCYADPGRVSDQFYQCAAGDGGGVHTNSGVDNHGYSLLVDGGAYNHQTIAGIGLTKAAHIYFRAKTNYQGPATDFAEHADALEQSCADLVGVNLNSLTDGTPSGEIISPADCGELAKALLAVEMRTPPTQCNFQTLLKPNPPDLCDAGKAPVTIFSDDFEGDVASWTTTHTAVVEDDFTPREWVVSGSLPSGRTGSAFFAIDFMGGTCAPGGDESGVLHLDSPAIEIPAGVTAPKLTFEHWIASEALFDGGNVRISKNGGPWTLVADTDFVFNPHNATLASVAAGNTNPMAGQRAFTGSDGGSVSGSWGRSIVNLAPYASPGDSVRLRFDFGTDGCGGTFGWYLDDVTVSTCAPVLKVTADDATKVYGSPNPAFTATFDGFLPGDDPSVLGGTLTFTTPASQTSPAGTYPITPGGLTSFDYAIQFVDGTLSVTPAPLTITVNDSSKVYGSPNPAFSVSYAGFVNLDGPASLTGTLVFTTAADPNSPVGSYPVSASGLSSPNYEITYLPGTLNVTRAPLTIKANDASRVEGAPNPAFTATFTGFVAGDDAADLTGALAFATTATPASAPGTYPIVPSGVSSPNYMITFQNGTLTVLPGLNGKMFGLGFIDGGKKHHHFVFRVSQDNRREFANVEYWVHDDGNRCSSGDHDFGSRGRDDRDYGRDHRKPPSFFDSTSIQQVIFSDDPAFKPGRDKKPMVDTVVVAGTGKWNGKKNHTFEVKATDKGEPGRNRDTFSIVVKDPAGKIVSQINSDLDGGNVESTRLK